MTELSTVKDAARTAKRRFVKGSARPLPYVKLSMSDLCQASCQARPCLTGEAIPVMRSRWRYWTAILLLLLLPMPLAASALRPLSHHDCCDGQRAMVKVQDATKACPEHAGAHPDVPSCGASPDGAQHSSGTCSECLGLSGLSPALPQRDIQSVPLASSVAPIPARSVYLPAPPPSRLERPPRHFSV